MQTIGEIMKTLTLEEKAALCQGASFWFTQDIPEKGIPAIMMTDGPHGLRKQTGETDHLGIHKSVPATCFPSAAAMACSWDRDLIQRVGEALGEECLEQQVSVLLGPGANIKRSPLCGRNFEYFSEDPYLSSQMAKHHILGVQSKGVGTSLKHFAVNNQETCRMTVNDVIDERTLREIYLASFEAAVKEAKPWTVMAAYNRINGEFCCENEHLLGEILRREWGYEGVVVSDWGATNDQVKGIAAGFDLRMPHSGQASTDKIVSTVKNGTLSEEKLDETVCRILTLVKQGIEHRVEGYRADMETHQRLAVRAAEESAVLLKNKNGILPVRKGEKLALIGGFAKNIRCQGGGSSHVNMTVNENMLDVLAQKFPSVQFAFARGYRLKQDKIDMEFVNEALSVARDADKIVLCLGLPDRMESEGFDRKHLRLPENQVHLLGKLTALKKPIAVVLFAGAPVEMPWLKKADALLAMYTAGQGAAEAAVDLLFGEANPCGKLAETYPEKLAHTPCSLAYPRRETAHYEEGVFVGYRYYEKKELPVLFPFGFGLSYTAWKYRNLRVSRKSIKDTDEITVSVDIANVGAVKGKEIVQLYVRDVESSVPRPVKELKDFVKVECEPGESKTVQFTLDKRSFAYYEPRLHDWYAESGKYEILLGTSSADIRLKTSVNMTSTVEIPKQYDKFVTMADLMKNPVGAQIMQKIWGAFEMPAPSKEDAAKLNDEDDVEDVAMDYAAMGMDMPLCKVADMSDGKFSDDMVQDIVDALNRKE